MSARTWIIELDKWLSTVGMSYEDVARKSGHDPKHIAKLFDEPNPKPGLNLYGDLLKASGGCLELGEISMLIEVLRSRAKTVKSSNADLGRRIGRDRSVISRLFNGRNPNPGLDLIADIVDAVGLDPQVKIRRRRLAVVKNQFAQANTRELPRAQAVGSRHAEVINLSDRPTTDRYMSEEMSSHLLEQDKIKSRRVDEANARAREAESQRNEARRRAQAAEDKAAAVREKNRQLQIKLAQQKHANDKKMFQALGLAGLGFAAIALACSSSDS